MKLLQAFMTAVGVYLVGAGILAILAAIIIIPFMLFSWLGLGIGWSFALGISTTIIILMTFAIWHEGNFG